MKIRYPREIFFLLLAVLFLPGSAYSQKVGYLDSKAVFAQYRGAADVRQEMNRIIEGWNKEISAKRKMVDSLEKSLELTDLVISSERRKAKKEEIALKKQELEAFVKEIFDPGGKADQKNRELSKPMAEKIGNVVKRVALDNNLLMVLDSSSGLVVYASKELDITEQVLEELAKEEGMAVKVLPSIALFPVWELDAEAIKRKFGKQAQEFIFTALERGQKLKPVAKKQVEDIVKDKGLSKSEVKEARGLEMAKILDASYMTLGQITQNLANNQITITIKVYNVERDQMIAEESEKVDGEGELVAGCESLAEKISQRISQQ
ncbi:MAG: OmpH family outer membrane protein [Candidatus Edwardsbacteria bacterium]|nr:OmpH family outer membrane protein [Candidatus Edwardsbacteria bacterium]